MKDRKHEQRPLKRHPTHGLIQAVHRTRILSASIRYVNSVSQSFANGADIVTMPPSVFEKMYHHVLTDKGLEIFDKDYAAIQNK